MNPQSIRTVSHIVIVQAMALRLCDFSSVEMSVFYLICAWVVCDGMWSTRNWTS